MDVAAWVRPRHRVVLSAVDMRQSVGRSCPHSRRTAPLALPRFSSQLSSHVGRWGAPMSGLLMVAWTRPRHHVLPRSAVEAARRTPNMSTLVVQQREGRRRQ